MTYRRTRALGVAEEILLATTAISKQAERDKADSELGRLAYLASPYSHPDPAVRQRRYADVRMSTVHLLRRGYHVWAPIVYTHHLAEAGMPVEWVFWEQFDLMMLRRCQELWILMLDGWRDSEGIRGELWLARRLSMPVRLLSMGDVDAGVPKNPTLEGHEYTKTELQALAEEWGWEVATNANRV